MKYLFIIFILFSTPVFSQRDNAFKAYDSVNKITEINDFGTKNKIFIKGNWKDFDYSKYQIYQLITHCPILINENNLILETWIRHDIGHNWKRKSDKAILNKITKGQLKYWHFNGTTYTIVASNINDNYVVYKIESHLREAKMPEVIINAYYLFGVKDSKVYRLAIQNFGEGEFMILSAFLTEIYFSN